MISTFSLFLPIMGVALSVVFIIILLKIYRQDINTLALLTVSLLALGSIVLTISTIEVVIPNTGTDIIIENDSDLLDIRIYNSENDVISSISWGMLEPNDTVQRKIYIVNYGSKLAYLNLRTTNWYPEEAIDYIDMFWNYKGNAISSKLVEITLTLHVSSLIKSITSFTFNMIIVVSDSNLP